MTEEQFKHRTFRFALAVIGYVDSLPKALSSAVIGKQLFRSGTSVGANYRSACRARSTADMISKLSIAEEEADEAQYWLELLKASGLGPNDENATLTQESEELTAMLVASINTLKARETERLANSRSRKIQNPKSEIQNDRNRSRISPTSASTR